MKDDVIFGLEPLTERRLIKDLLTLLDKIEAGGFNDDFKFRVNDHHAYQNAKFFIERSNKEIKGDGN